MGIDSLQGNAGLFSWVNLRSLLVFDNLDGEMKLWRVILEEIGLNVSPGCSFHCEEPGWFRVCYGNMSEDEMNVALGRIKSFMSGGRAQEEVLLSTSKTDISVAQEEVLSTDISVTAATAAAACTALGLDASDLQPEPLAH